MHYSIAGRRRQQPALIFVALLAAAFIYGLSGLAPMAHAEGPGSGTPTTVSLGDSFISGEAGRWAGNTNESSSKTDALGSTAYDDNSSGNGELIAGCHRSKAAEVYIGGGVNGVNLACSGAKTSSFSTEGLFKPGIDFYNSGGHEGQALMLQHFAATHNVKLVALSIGGNNFNFAGIVTTCVEDFLGLLLQRRKLGDEQLHLGQRLENQGRNRNRDPQRRDRDDERGLHELAVHDPRAELPLADSQRIGIPLHAERLQQTDHRRMRLLEQGRQLRQRDDAADDRQHRARRRFRGGPVERQDDGIELRLQQPPPVRQRRGATRGRGAVQLESDRSGEQERVVQPDPHDRNAVRDLS